MMNESYHNFNIYKSCDVKIFKTIIKDLFSINIFLLFKSRKLLKGKEFYYLNIYYYLITNLIQLVINFFFFCPYTD